MKSTTRKHRKSQRQVQREVRYFWGGVIVVGLLTVLLMYVGLT